MSPPGPVLDRRRAADIRAEARRNVATHVPEWTNQSGADPGAALIELFAWMGEEVIGRLNQVPDNFYARLLNLVGIVPFPATAARADLTFWLVGAQAQPVTVPRGTRVSTETEADDAEEPVVFTTLTDLVVRQPTLVAALSAHGAEDVTDVWADLQYPRASVRVFPSDPIRPDDELYFGFEAGLGGSVLQLDVSVDREGIGVDPSDPPLRWEAWDGSGWVRVGVYHDSTGGLNRTGAVQLRMPLSHRPTLLGSASYYWLRARLLEARNGQPAYRTSPEIRQVDASVIGGTVVAEHSDFVFDETLGVSTGAPDQVFLLGERPLLKRNEGEQRIVVRTAEGDVLWDEVDDFLASDARARHVVVEPTVGEVRFGPEIRSPSGVVRQHGAVPPAGAEVVATQYRFGGGARGNVGSEELTRMLSAVPFVDRVENVRPALGGADAETIDAAKRRGPAVLRAGDRAVTPRDFERLVLDADHAIARARCVPPDGPGQSLRLLLVPKLEGGDRMLHIDDFALTSAQMRRVQAYVDQRRQLGVGLEIGTPYYQGVIVQCRVTATESNSVGRLAGRVGAALRSFLSPIEGGADGTGWPFETDLTSALVAQHLETVTGVARVDDVLLFEYDLRNERREPGPGKELVYLLPDSLFLPVQPEVEVG